MVNGPDRTGHADKAIGAIIIPMGVLAVLVGIAIIVIVLWDALETIVLPRTVTRRVGLSMVMNALFKLLYKAIGRLVSNRNSVRERWLGAFAPLSLLVLTAVWAWGLIFAFALIAWGINPPLTNGEPGSFGVFLYVSAVTFFTLGYGDVTTITAGGRSIAVIEAGIGFGFLALVIGYIPVLYGSFSRREATILLLDARAGSPPTAGEFLRRYDADNIDALEQILAELERWSANVLESYLSYPTLALYRSQHERMSWLGALTMIMDSCSLLQVSCDQDKPSHKRLIRQAELSYALARHVVVDLAYVLNIPPLESKVDRLPREIWDQVAAGLKDKGLWICDADEAFVEIQALRKAYEPYITGISKYLFLPLPPWVPTDGEQDSWEVAAWDEDRHF